jgi:hypothetical protein
LPIPLSDSLTTDGVVTAKPPVSLVIITSLLLVGYLCVVAWAWFSPSTDPQGGMAVGFLMLATLFFLGLAGLLWYGVVTRRSRLVWFLFAVCALPSLSVLARGIYLVVRWLGHAS